MSLERISTEEASPGKVIAVIFSPRMILADNTFQLQVLMYGKYELEKAAD